MKPLVKHNFTRDQVLRANEAMNRGDKDAINKSACLVARSIGHTRTTAEELNLAFDAAQRRIHKTV
ncbi:hypothetical protein JFK97_01960 [Chromobacterium phragmitis]|uniref:hypothetical protein n=1 Tax=Chromobacterium amazonense TaxID=1382803 RepID=UPI0021B70F3F|nr:hypothetical protein [Chromobacterium amazonense]MBM2883144.1 hypothetical protein [Chromobacterium amazonense]MDE1712796.1 hypothetical protein [Chromobacterium amazonense]